MHSEFSDGTTRIRPLGPDDADALFVAACESINEVYPWLEWCHPDYSWDEASSSLALREEYGRRETNMLLRLSRPRTDNSSVAVD